MATIVILISFILMFAIALVVVVPLIITQFSQFAQVLPDYVSQLQQLIANPENSYLPKWMVTQIQNAKQNFSSLMSEGAGFLGGLLNQLWNSGKTLIDVISLLVVTPVVAFYILLDWDRMVEKVDSWVPRDQVHTIRQLAREMDDAVSGFIRGQGSLCLILGIYYAVGLSLVGLNFGLLIGFVAGMISFIPYIGSLVGLILAVGVALMQFWPDYGWIIATMAVFFSGQFIEGNILQPSLSAPASACIRSGSCLPCWPSVPCSASLVFLIAVPAAAMIGVLVRFALSRIFKATYISATRQLCLGMKRQQSQTRPCKSPKYRMTETLEKQKRQRAEQLPLALTHDAAIGRDDLLVAEPVSAAVAMIDAWPHWNAPVVILTGPAGCGKSHLASIWREKAAAQIIHPKTGAHAATVAAAGPVLFEDADRAGF